MVVVKIVGGLASQLHKYAIGRALALRHGSRLKLDLEWYRNRPATDTPWPYQLSKFAVDADVATPGDLDRMRGMGFGRRVVRRLARALGVETREAIVSKSFMPPEEFAALPDNVYLQGEWVGDAYFAHVRTTLLRDFRLVVPLSHGCRVLAGDIGSAVWPVSIHVRRGDYLSNPSAHAFHHVTELDYYVRAAQAVRAQQPEASFFIFSDDPDWAAANLAPQFAGACRVVRGLDNHEDLFLMSQCRGNIICNSGFGWMAAWLNQNADRKIVAPRKWVKDERVNEILVRDGFPEGWATLL